MIAKFLPYLRAHRWQVAWALAQVFLIAGFELLKPWPLQIVIDYVLGGKKPPAGGPFAAWPSAHPVVAGRRIAAHRLPRHRRGASRRRRR